MTIAEAIAARKQVLNMSRAELQETVSVMARAANKRILRASRRGNEWVAAAPGLQKYVTGEQPKFSTRGKNLNELRNEYLRVREFLTGQTTVAGAKKWRERQEELWGQKFSTPDELANFWEAYNKAKEAQPLNRPWGEFDSKQIIAAMGEIIRATPLDDEQQQMERVFQRVNALSSVGIKATYENLINYYESGDDDET